MKILALNCGSSSVKYQLYDWDKHILMSKGIVERVGLGGSFINYTLHDEKKHIEFDCNNPNEAVKKIISIITDNNNGLLQSIDELSAVSHRVTHGGSYYPHSVIIDDDVIKNIEKLSTLAPLHNPHNLAGIMAIKDLLPHTHQVAVFDTAFHQTMPDYAYRYAIAKKWYEEYGIRRYGFHGTSHLYVSRKAAALMGKKHTDINVITLHIGNGASVTAIKNGKSVDTSLGFASLDGVIMGTRPGNIDPTIPLYMQEHGSMSIKDVYHELYKNSGIYGLTGKYTDRRDVMAAADNGDQDSQLALTMESYRLKQYIGMYMATLGKVDAIVFTAGVGENSPYARRTSIEGLENMGIILNNELNEGVYSSSGDTLISAPESKTAIYMIPTNEELIFIEDTVGLLTGEYKNTESFLYSFQK